MIHRVLAAGFGAVLFGILVPLVYTLCIGWPDSGFSKILLLAAAGLAVGAGLGALFPKVFGFVFEVFMEIGN